MAKNIMMIAGAINNLYCEIFNYNDDENDMTEMKMHKLLYFAQKNHYSIFGKWLFDDDFQGWVHGPVNKRVRDFYLMIPEIDADELTPEEEYTLRETLYEYGQYSAIQLRHLSHDEDAYKISRQGLSKNEIGTEIIQKENIIEDVVSMQENTLQ